MKFKTLILSLFVCTTLFADQMAIGSWRTHLAYSNTQIIAQTPEKVYGVSGGALYAVGKEDFSIELLSKITGLNDNNVSYIAYSEEEKTLVIAYGNSNIDLITDAGIYNITDLYRKNMAGSKNINSIYCHDKYAYLSCAFGIMVINLEKQETTDTYIIGDNGANESVLSFSMHDNQLFALTESGIKTAPNTGVNLANFENWTKTTTPTSAKNKRLVIYNDTFYLLQTDGNVYKQNAGTWTKIYSKINDISGDSTELFVMEQEQFHYITLSEKKTFANSGIYMASYDAENDEIWAAADYAGIAKITPTTNATNVFCPNGPAVNTAWRIKYSDNKIFVVQGGRWAVQYQRPGYVMMFENGMWTNITPDVISNVTGLKSIDFVDIAIDPSDNSHFFVAAYGMGIYEFRNNQFYKLYNADNSGVETIYPTRKPETAYYYYHRIDGLTYDKNGNLWFLNAKTNAVIKYMKPNSDGKTVDFAYSNIKEYETPQDIIISQNNDALKWVLFPRAASSDDTSIFAFFDNGTDKTNDDQTRIFSYFTDQDGNRYAPQNFRCIAQDQNNQLWIGSSDGICVITNQTKVFDDNFTCMRIKIPRNDGTNLADYLLDGIQINAIAVDGSNRKWIGTETNGVFLMSEDGLETIEHFTSDNSPLLSNTILSIGINEKTGEVFFGTGNGLCSYQSDASEGNESFTDVHAFPNPVREDYYGVITITGLMTDSRVKITDIAGNLVYETISNGGIATWDGNRSNGERVATGIYLAMCFSSDGKQYETTKILVINR